MAYRGRFIPKNPTKYNGDPSKIIYRSSWELKMFRWCDLHPDILEWQSEEIFVTYRNPAKKGNLSRYYPDIILKRKNKEGVIEKFMIEIKPKKETYGPNIENKYKTPTGRVSRRYLNESIKYAINTAKWEAAQKYCEERNMKFVIFTEDHIKPLGI
jgi:hypothetical protein